ncbi:hypothetical protein DAPPUDRAFT_117093 [Daphnia pulex]|uniref:Endonuclease/exonuclease/phosphatase domain-containing protein n=1 Tax=Daphnia pulex TaxID=6669 RepID=E9HRI4_DAPPU|nr:hypothetical protein DAPPUDRAFT_117093 [Daphnia pulex]|eukprot:EFX65653.1 hypothetical protein DAPPUDRAFT_117093 [Daphnia pulex]
MTQDLSARAAAVLYKNQETCLLLRSTKVRLILVYRPPDKSCAEFLKEFSSLLELTSTVSSALVITGDFNLHLDVPNDSYTQRFCAIIESVGFRQHVHQPTHNKGHTLDLVLSRNTDNIIASTHVDNDVCISDQSLIECVLNVRLPQLPTKTISFRPMRSIDMDLRGKKARTCSVREQIADCNGDKRSLFCLIGDLTG